MTSIHIPVRVKDSEDPIGCTCRFGSWFMDIGQFEAHVSGQRQIERNACPKCGQPLARSKRRGWNRIRVDGRLAHKDCQVDEGKAQAQRKVASRAERAQHRSDVHLAIARGERLP